MKNAWSMGTLSTIIHHVNMITDTLSVQFFSPVNGILDNAMYQYDQLGIIHNDFKLVIPDNKNTIITPWQQG